MSIVHFVLPNDIDDPLNPSGGNVYDRRVCLGLAASGWSVREHPVRGGWPRPDENARADLARELRALRRDSIVLVDGLVGSTVPDVLEAYARRLRLAILMHMPMADEREREAVSLAAVVLTTSEWGRRRVLDLYGVSPERVHAAPPGVDPAPLGTGSDEGSELLCVAAVTPGKGHDVLVEALASISDLAWRCVCVGPLDRDPAYAQKVRRRARSLGITDRISFVGPRTGRDLDATYAAADLLVLASRGETYGMVVTEALARGIPVVVGSAGGLPEALGQAPDGSRPGLLVRPDDPAGLAGALRRWVGDTELRRELKRSARLRRSTLTGWAVTSTLIANALSGMGTRVGADR
jgi:glycosyltransferase involved in cell wall biosynthesis